MEWDSATHYREKISVTADNSLGQGLSDLMDELVENFKGTNDEGDYYTKFSTALYYNTGTKTLYSASFGIILD